MCPERLGQQVYLRPAQANEPADAVVSELSTKAAGVVVGRDAACAALLGAIAAGHGFVAVIGPAGCGKTTVLDAAAAHLARDGRRVIRIVAAGDGNGLMPASTNPYNSCIQIFYKFLQ